VSAKRKFAVPERIHEPMWLRQVGVPKSRRGVKTMKKVLGCLSMAALAVMLATTASAQTRTLKASVPFDFVVAGRTLPAGDYVVSGVNAIGLLAIQNVSSGAAPTLTTSNSTGRPGDGGEAFLTFHRYGSDYFLATICDGYTGGRSIGMSSAERERANMASLRKPEVVMVLARR
jgi:hypothetical protein